MGFEGGGVGDVIKNQTSPDFQRFMLYIQGG